MKHKVERLLLLIGTGLACICAGAGVQTVIAKQTAEHLVTQQHREPGEGADRQGASQDGPIIPEGSFAGTYLGSDGAQTGPAHVIGRLQIKEISLSVPIISGIADPDLIRGVGHIPGSGNAGGLGNMAVAGHRDTFFRPLRNVQIGMMVAVSGTYGTYHYQVDRTEIVTPEQLRVLDIGDHPELTMITCYPFNYIGAAPKRFVVFAHLVSAAPDDTP